MNNVVGAGWFYLVRIYRRLKAGPESLVGTIKLGEQREVKTFKTVREFMEILMQGRTEKERRCCGKGKKNAFSQRRRDYRGMPEWNAKRSEPNS